MSAYESGHDALRSHTTAEEQLFGFWVFLMSDLVLFALLFAVYATMTSATAGGPGAKQVFGLGSVAIQTGVLLASSFTIGMATLAMTYGRSRGSLLLWLAVTLALGALFLGLETHDLMTMVANGAPPTRSGFLSAFFVLVPTHGLHVTAGCIWTVTMIVQVLTFGRSGDVKTRILRLSLFWHFLDVVWVGIFTFVYLQGLA